jgi:hypothetical protein
MEVSGLLYAPAALPPENSPPVPLDCRLGGPQSRPERGGEEKKPCPSAENRTPIVQLVVSHYPCLFKSTVIPRFTSLIRSPKLLVRRKLVKRKLISHFFPTGTTIGLREEGARIRENWLVNWKKRISLCISYERKLVNRLLVYRGTTVISDILLWYINKFHVYSAGRSADLEQWTGHTDWIAISTIFLEPFLKQKSGWCPPIGH